MENRKPHIPFVQSRREFLQQAGSGFGGVALSWLLAQDAQAQEAKVTRVAPILSGQLAPKAQMVSGKAKAVIFIFCGGAPSHLDTWDFKPGLITNNTKTMEGGRKLMRSPFNFKPYGKSGIPISDAFANVGTCVDDLCLIHSMTATNGNHTPMVFEMNTGNFQQGHPAMGAWVTYGLGTENQNLPAFVVMTDNHGNPSGGSPNWSNGFMPAVYGGTVLRAKGSPFLDLKRSGRYASGSYRARLDLLAEINAEHLDARPDDLELESRIASYEMAYRMQAEAPRAVDITRETARTRALYGMDSKRTEEFGRRCLLARRLVEHGVRFVQLYCGGGGWDAHDSILDNHGKHAGESDKPIAGLLTDLKQRGMLDSTLVVWAGEFGRTPTSQNNGGRDHNPGAHTVWMAGGGVKGGQRLGSSGDIGLKAEGEGYTVRHLHATILRAVGLDDKSLTYLHNGRHQRLTETGSKIIPGVLA